MLTLIIRGMDSRFRGNDVRLPTHKYIQETA